MKERYVDGPRFHRATQKLIADCNELLDHYSKRTTLTVRQLFYRLVANKSLHNTKRDYDNFARTLTHARLAGEVDWDLIDDPTRSVQQRPIYDGPKHALTWLADSYSEDLWIDQDTRVVCAVEKETLLAVAGQVCGQYSVPIMHTRGYPSATSMRAFVKQHIMAARQQNCVVLLLSDYDQIGLDLERDLRERIRLFSADKSVSVFRVALEHKQIADWNVPRMYDDRDCYELEAVDPILLGNELQAHIRAQCSDLDALYERRASMIHVRTAIQQLAIHSS